MACEELSLNWDNHHGALVAVFENLLERNTLVDCTIAAEGQYVKAHKVILCASSSYFELLFSQEKEKNPIIILKDIRFRELKAMIEFMYRGSVKIPVDHLQDFVDAAESLQIKGLGVDQRKCNSGIRADELKNVVKRKDDFSPRPNKRVKNSLLNENEENSLDLSSSMLSVNKSVRSDSHSLHKIEQSVTKSLLCFPDSVSNSSAFVNVGQESYESPEENTPCTTDQSSVLAETETVVKTEPEDEQPVPESILPDNLVEPKKEEFEQEEITILDSDDGAEESLEADGTHDENSQQLSSFPQSQEPIMDDSYALEELQHSNIEGSFWSCSDGGQLASSWCQSAAAASATSTNTINPVDGTSLEDMHLSPTIKALPSLTGITKHVRARTHMCPICGVAQISPAVLARHMRKHTGERPFRCPQCGRHFSQRSDLTRHQLLHTGLRPYKCAVCGKSFNRSNTLQIHEMIHTGNRPYSCEQCGKRFIQRTNLKTHLFSHMKANQK